MPDKNTRWIIGTTITVAIALSAQMALMISMISGLREDTNQRFNQVDQRFSQVNQRFNQIDQRFNQIDQRFNERFNGMEQRLDRMEQRLDGFDERLRAVEIAFAKVDQRLSTLERSLLPSSPAAPN